MTKAISPFRYYFPHEEVVRIANDVTGILKAGSFLSSGQFVDKFQAAFANYVGSRYALAVSSGTAALEVILRCLGVQGKQVIIPTNTFAATAFAAIHAGASPIFADCLDDLTVDPSDVAQLVTPATAAIITVHIGGRISPATLELVRIAKEFAIPLVEDAAHAHGSRLSGRHAGTFGIAGAFSFFSTKVMTTGEGGMIITNDEDIYRQASIIRDQAKVDGRNLHQDIGYNWRMTEFQAILGLSQLRILDEVVRRRIEIARLYDELLSTEPRLRRVPVPTSLVNNYYKYILMLDGDDPEDLRQRLRANHTISLAGKVYDIPCHLQPVFGGLTKRQLPRSEKLCPTHICLPVYQQLSDLDVEYIAEKLREELR